MQLKVINYFHKIPILAVQLGSEKKKKKLYGPFFYGWSSTASRLEPLQGGSLLFTNVSASFFQGTFYTFREGSFAGKQLGELRNEFLQMFSETLLNKLLFLPKKVIV